MKAVTRKVTIFIKNALLVFLINNELLSDTFFKFLSNMWVILSFFVSYNLHLLINYKNNICNWLYHKIACSVSSLGMRICTDLLKDHVRAFSVLSTYKHACVGLNMAGAHGGIKLSGEGYSVKEMKNIIEGYGRELTKKGFLGI